MLLFVIPKVCWHGEWQLCEATVIMFCQNAAGDMMFGDTQASGEERNAMINEKIPHLRPSSRLLRCCWPVGHKKAEADLRLFIPLHEWPSWSDELGDMQPCYDLRSDAVGFIFSLHLACVCKEWRPSFLLVVLSSVKCFRFVWLECFLPGLVTGIQYQSRKCNVWEWFMFQHPEKSLWINRLIQEEPKICVSIFRRQMYF